MDGQGVSGQGGHQWAGGEGVSGRRGCKWVGRV